DVLEAPSEEIKTPITRSRSIDVTEPDVSAPEELVETQYLANPTIDDAAIEEKEIRGSKDSQFEEAQDNDLLEWLPIGASGDQQEANDAENDVPMDELKSSNEGPEYEAPVGVTVAQEDVPVDEAEAEKTENETFLEVDAPVDEEEPSDRPQDEAPLDEQSLHGEQSKNLAPMDEETDKDVDDMKVENIYSDADSLPDPLSQSNKEGEAAVGKASDELVTANSSEVFIYQVVSAGSGEAISGELALSGEEKNSDLGDDATNDEEVPMDEAIEVVTERFNTAEDYAEEQVNRMNASESSESDTSEEAESEEKDSKTEESDAPQAVENKNDASKVEETDPKCDSYESAVQTPAVSVDGDDPLNESTDSVQQVRDLASVKPEDFQEERPAYEDDDQVTQIMGNTGADTPRSQQSSHAMNGISEAETETPEEDASNTKENIPETVESMSPIITTRSPAETAPTPVASPRPVASVTTQEASSIPSPRRVALVENRRAVQSKVDDARNAMIGETALPTGLPNPKKDIVHRVKKVKFKNRYPVPPPAPKLLQPSEIVFRNQTPVPKDRLHFSKPKKDLKELLEAAIGDSIHRRSNALGALKVLSTQKKNKTALVGTKGFLDATVFAINDDISSHEDFEAALAARTRAVSVLLNVSDVKNNRYHVFNHPGLADSLVKCMVEDRTDARALACSVLATVAKSATCREPIASTSRMLDTLAIILKGREPSSFASSRQPHIEEEKKDYSGDDEASQTVFSGSYSSGSSDHSSVGSEFAEARNRARLSACAALLHLSKECSVARKMCESSTILFCLVGTCNETDNPLHTKCLEILVNLTRFAHNNAIMTRYPGLVDTLIMNGNHKLDVDRLWAMRALQNLSSDSSSKTILGTATVLELLSVNIMRQKYEEQYAATAALYNISTEPGAVVPLTNTKNVVATLVHVAHNPTSPSDVRLMACDTLATLGLWLQTLAGAGTVPPEVDPIPLPTYVTSGWKRWEK
ncbi:MAG: hypothetical protein SGILL_003652, partial [Bacillariaceae sp.]